MLETIIYLLIGYCIAVLFPIPVVSSFIIRKWAEFFGKPTAVPVVEPVAPVAPVRSSKL